MIFVLTSAGHVIYALFLFSVLQDPSCLGPFLSLISATSVADLFNECVYTSVIASSLGPCEG